jgi:glycosyltransferase involved in cell wall biosynthesis
MTADFVSIPRVSVLVNTYNHERYIEQAIVSALEQDFPAADTEIIVVDDGSTDNTPAIIHKFASHSEFASRIRFIRKENGGQASAFNVGIPETHAELVAFLDGDDWWAKEKLSAVVEAFSKNPDVAAVGHGFFDTLSNGEPSELVVPRAVCRVGLSGLEETRTATVAKCFLATSKLTVRRRILQRLGRIPEQLTFCADEPIMDAALALGGAILLDRPLAYYRYHESNMFGFVSTDPVRNRKRYDLQLFLIKFLRELLPDLGVTPEGVDIMVQRYQVDMDRFEALYGGGDRWQTFRAESRYFRQEYKNASAGYLLFKAAVAALTLLLSPARFYQLRDWYAKRNLRRVRETIGGAEPVFPEMYRRVRLLDRN